MRLVGWAALAVLVGGAMFGVGSLGHKGGKKTKVSRTSARDRAGLAALAAAADRVAEARPEDVEPPESPPELEVDDPEPHVHIQIGEALRAEDEPTEIQIEDVPDVIPARWESVSGVIEGPGSHDFTPVYVTRGGETIARAYTGEDGKFTFELDVNDETPITVSAETSDGWSGEATMIPAQAQRGVRVRLSTELADVIGHVTDGAGRPVAFVEILDGDQVLGSSDAEGEFSVRLGAHRAATLRFDSFGVEVARTQVITKMGGPELTITASGRSVTCPIAARTRGLDLDGMYMSVSRVNGGGWSMGRGGFHGDGMPDVTVIPGPDFQALEVDVRAGEKGVSAHLGTDGGCEIGEREIRYEKVIY